MQSLTSERKRNQRKSPLTPKKSFRKEESPPAIAMRVGGRVKKAKIPFDPSDAVSKRRKTESDLSMKVFAGKDGSVMQSTCCQLCKKPDKLDGFVTCKGDCSAKIHLNCMQLNCEHFGKNEEHSWRCNNCQSCTVCVKGNSPGKPLLKCYICFMYYHQKCHGDEERIKIVKQNRFCCAFCEKSRKTSSIASRGPALKKTRAFAQTRVKPSTENKFSGDGKIGFLGFNANEVVDSSSDDECNDAIAKPARRPSTPYEQQARSSTDNRSSVDGEIVDASDWSGDQVYKYFKNIFPKHAHVFKEHEIDGPTLGLLKRRDIIQGFDIKIGPALKIYHHVLMLQTKIVDPTLSWH